jgi:hypothetical protein
MVHTATVALISVIDPRPTIQICFGDRAHQRTFWLGTMNAVELGASEPPLKNLYAATITMISASTAIRSICLGS